VEATPGYVITQIHTSVAGDYAYKPNLVIINAGTNDCVQNIDVANAHVRLEDMINDIWSNIGDTTVIIVSTVLINSVAAVNANSAIVNPNYRSLVASLRSQGKPIYLTDFDGWITVDDIGSDGTHPTDYGYTGWLAAFGQLSPKRVQTARSRHPRTQRWTPCQLTVKRLLVLA
jgi:lysophospholipase L1-like esterase